MYTKTCAHCGCIVTRITPILFIINSQSDNEFLRTRFDDIVKSNQGLVESTKNMSQTNLILAELLNKKE